MKRLVSAALCFILLAASLAGCSNSKETPPSPDTPGNSSVQTPPSNSETDPTPPSSSPTENMSDEDIIALYDSYELDVLEIYDSGDITFVQYKTRNEKAIFPHHFDWLFRDTGERVFALTAHDAQEVSMREVDLGDQPNHKYVEFMVLTSGIDVNVDSQEFPEVYYASLQVTDRGAKDYHVSKNTYYMPVKQSFTMGKGVPETLTGIYFIGGDAEYHGDLVFGFDAQPGKELEFVTPATWIPKMEVTYAGENCTITMYDTVPAEDLEIPEGSGLSFGFTVKSLEYDGTNTIVTLRFTQSVSRYSITIDHLVHDSLPHAIFEFADSSFYPGYPEGW